MVKLVDSISALGRRRILLLGDFMLDSYTIGRVKRISPEAPVPVINVLKEYDQPGGAGNVLLNFASLGLQVVPVGRVGGDSAGEKIRTSFLKEGCSSEAIFVQEGYSTPVKNRIIAANQQLMRLDFEEYVPISPDIEDKVIDFCAKALDDVSLVAISDYGKGFLSSTLLKAVIDLAKAKGVVVIVDPKGSDFSKYRGATVIKPNFGEALAASELPSHSSLQDIARDLLRQTESHALFVTRSEEGISIFSHEGSEEHFPVARIREVKDVTGAGDTVLAVLACALANGLPLKAGAKLSNIAAGIAVEQVGCVRVSLADISKRLHEEDVTNKVFDQNHLFILETVLKESPFALLTVESTQKIDKDFFKTLKQLSSEMQVLVYVKEAALDPDTIHFLATLDEVDFILIDEKCVSHVLHHFEPKVILDLATI